MARAPKKAANAAPDTPTTSTGIAPLFAMHSINPFGKDGHAPAGSIFVPVSEDERDELLDLEAARELTEDELVVFAAKQGAIVDATPADEPTDPAVDSDPAAPIDPEVIG